MRVDLILSQSTGSDHARGARATLTPMAANASRYKWPRPRRLRMRLLRRFVRADQSLALPGASTQPDGRAQCIAPYSREVEPPAPLLSCPYQNHGHLSAPWAS